MELIGKSSINPLIFYSGKISGYVTWIIFIYSFCNKHFVYKTDYSYDDIIASFTFFLGLIFIIVSLYHLGKSTRLGLPLEKTELKTRGIYKISRNPMYVGFGLLTMTSIIYTWNIFILIAGVYSLIVYHLIIKNEEKFLTNRFGAAYENYKKSVTRYL